MNNPTRIHLGKQGRRPHFIAAWADKRGLNQKELAHAIGADTSNVSRWFSGTCPSVEWQEKLAAFFSVEIEALFRDPDDDWLVRFFKGRSKDEIERIKATMEIAFPRNGTK